MVVWSDHCVKASPAVITIQQEVCTYFLGSIQMAIFFFLGQAVCFKTWGCHCVLTSGIFLYIHLIMLRK